MLSCANFDHAEVAAHNESQMTARVGMVRYVADDRQGKAPSTAHTTQPAESHCNSHVDFGILKKGSGFGSAAYVSYMYCRVEW